MHFLEFNPKALEGFMRVDMRGFLTQPVPRKGGTVKCFIRREKHELVSFLCFVCQELDGQLLFARFWYVSYLESLY